MGFLQHRDEQYGDGQVVFLTGSPAQMRSSYTFDKDRSAGSVICASRRFRELVTELSSEALK
jgi:hypothetical protein